MGHGGADLRAQPQGSHGTRHRHPASQQADSQLLHGRHDQVVVGRRSATHSGTVVVGSLVRWFDGSMVRWFNGWMVWFLNCDVTGKKLFIHLFFEGRGDADVRVLIEVCVSLLFPFPLLARSHSRATRRLSTAFTSSTAFWCRARTMPR